MEEKEIWKDIEGFEGLYQVSNMNNIKSLERTVWDNRGYYRTVHERILKARKNNNDYLQVNLWKDGKAKKYLVHQLVATAFCENPEGYTEVNHINEDKADCRAENLEWCSRSYNLSYNGRAKKVAEKKSKPVIAIHKINGLILKFPSAHEAERQLGIAQNHICACCKGRLKSIGGFYWYYAD